MLKKPISGKAEPATQKGKFSSSIKAGKCTATKVTWKPQTKKPKVKRLKLLDWKASLRASFKVWVVPIFDDSDFLEKLSAKEKINIIAAIKDKYINDWDQPTNLIKYPIKGTIINWPKDPAAITIPRDKVLFSTLTDLPTAPNTTAVPHPAEPKPNKAWDPIISNELFTFDIHARPINTKIIRNNDARHDPYLSDNAPNSC